MTDHLKTRGNHIERFFHCGECIKELPKGMSPREFSRLEMGWTTQGFQVWCIRHEKNVLDIDFKGQKVVAL